MATSSIDRLPKSTVELTITIPWSEIKETYDVVFGEISATVELAGFRKGKAPRELVEKHLDKTRIYEEVVKKVVPKVYSEALKLHSLKPIISPQVQIVAAKEGEDWKIKANLAEKPGVNLKNYRGAVAKAKVKTELWVPGKESTVPEKKDKDDQARLGDILKALLAEVEVEIPDLLVEQEVNRMLARLLDQTQKLGLTVEQYLVAQGKTSDQLRAEYAQQATETLKLDLILESIAEKENITVGKEEIEKALETVKDEKEREQLRANSYYLASLLRQQKTLDSLASPVVK